MEELPKIPASATDVLVYVIFHDTDEDTEVERREPLFQPIEARLKDDGMGDVSRDRGGGLSFVPHLGGFCEVRVKNNFCSDARRIVQAHMEYGSLSRNLCALVLQWVRCYDVMLGKLGEDI